MPHDFTFRIRVGVLTGVCTPASVLYMNTDKRCSHCQKPAEFAGCYSSCCNEREMMPFEIEEAGL